MTLGRELSSWLDRCVLPDTTPLDDCGLETRVNNILWRNNIKTLAQLKERLDEVESFKEFGASARKSLVRRIKELGTGNADYVPGDEPVPVGSLVDYFGGHAPGRYHILGHHSPTEHLPSPPTLEEVAEVYPDGVAYELWPADLPVTIGFRDRAVYYVRRISFAVISAPSSKNAPNPYL